MLAGEVIVLLELHALVKTRERPWSHWRVAHGAPPLGWAVGQLWPNNLRPNADSCAIFLLAGRRTTVSLAACRRSDPLCLRLTAIDDHEITHNEVLKRPHRLPKKASQYYFRSVIWMVRWVDG